MASAAGRRNILRELETAGSSQLNASLPLTPTSPDEEIIRLRGRRKPIPFDLDESPVKLPGRNSPKKTPIKRTASPLKYLNTPIRSSPRKRLNLSPDALDFDEATLEDMSITNRRAKRQKIHTLVSNSSVNLEKGLMALSHAQLVQLVSSAATSSPEIKQVLQNLVPTPDLLPLEKRLYFFQRNIFKAYPRNVWGSQDDSYCYLRVRTHIDTFKKECLEQCRSLVESENWPVVLEYILIGWSYAKGLPNWATAAHNKSKEFCIRQLTTHFLLAVRKAELNKIALLEILERLRELNMGNELLGCKELVETLLKDAA